MWVLHRVLGLARKPTAVWALLCVLQVLSVTSSSMHLPSRHIHLLWHGLLHDMQCWYLLRYVLMFFCLLQGENGSSPLVTGEFLHLPPSSMTLVSAESFFTHLFPHSSHFFMLSSIRYHTRVADGLRFGQCQVCLGSSCNRLCPSLGQILIFFIYNQ